MFDTRLNSFGQKPVCVSVGAVPSPLKVFATNKTDVHIDPIRSSVMKRMSFAHAHMNNLLRAAEVSKSRYIGISIPIKYSNFSRFYKKLGPFYKKLRCDKFGN